jgi:hypothetical protein
LNIPEFDPAANGEGPLPKPGKDSPKLAIFRKKPFGVVMLNKIIDGSMEENNSEPCCPLLNLN